MRPKWLPHPAWWWTEALVLALVSLGLIGLAVFWLAGCVVAYGTGSQAEMTTHRAPAFRVDLTPPEPASAASAVN
jgi:hypothetical protein